MSPERAATVIVPTLGGPRLGRMLESLAAQTASHQTIVVDNGAPRGSVAAAAERLDGVDVIRLPENVGYTRAVNLGGARADGDVLVLLNDDCIVEPAFVERICAALDPGAGVAMAAGVMRDWRDSSLVDSAGMELDPTLLVFDYLNGEPVSVLERPVADPVGPSGAAAAFDRAAFLGVGGFDERLFAYWEDVDLVLRLRRLGFRCALAAAALGDHEHSATLGSGSVRKNYLMGFGRGYILAKWGVLSPRRLGPVLVREAVLCAGQAAVDRNLAGVRGRLRGYRAADAVEGYPSEVGFARSPDGALATLRRRARRRARLRHPAPPAGAPQRSLAVFHVAGISGPLRSLEAELRWLGERGRLTTVVPGPGAVADALAGAGEVVELDYEALTMPTAGPIGLALATGRLARDVRRFRAEIRRRRCDLVIAVTAMVPAVAIAARRERVPLVVYAGELFDRAGIRGAAASRLVSLTARQASAIIACSQAVAKQYAGRGAPIETVYPPVGAGYADGDGASVRELHGIPAGASLIASLGNLTAGRGQDLAVRALAAILDRHPEARYLIVGEPFDRPDDRLYRDRLVELIAELGLGERALLSDGVEAAADLYAAADVIVNPARVSESFGRVAFEAALAGAPAVITRVGAAGELLRDGESALLVAPEDPAAIAAAVSQLLDDRELGRRLAAAAREIAATTLTPEQSLAGFVRAVETALRAARRSSGRRG